jgi:hypothetical protein
VFSEHYYGGERWQGEYKKCVQNFDQNTQIKCRLPHFRSVYGLDDSIKLWTDSNVSERVVHVNACSVEGEEFAYYLSEILTAFQETQRR